MPGRGASAAEGTGGLELSWLREAKAEVWEVEGNQRPGVPRSGGSGLSLSPGWELPPARDRSTETDPAIATRSCPRQLPVQEGFEERD